MLDYTALDFETANSYRGSPCAVGLVRVRSGRPVAEQTWLMRPPAAVDDFHPFNTSIHGITAEMVAGAPRWSDLLPEIMDFIGDDVVVAHNAGFDIGVIRYACAADNIPWPEMRFLCTMVMSRRQLELASYRLPFVHESLGFQFLDHHDPLADARAVVDIVTGLSNLTSAADIDTLAAESGISVGRMSAGVYLGSVAKSGGAALRQADLNPEADESGYLYGRTVVFTGALMSMTRQVAWDECARIGAVAEKDVTKRTNVLVVGDINPAVLRPGSNLTGKARKAFDLQDRGQPIEVMTEDDFLRCVDGRALLPPDALVDQGGDTSPQPIPGRQRSVPLAERPTPKPPPPPRPLRREPIPTDQLCAWDGCLSQAAFKTRTKPTWCVEHIEHIQRLGGLKPVESFTRPDDWQLTECLTCTVHAHYRFVYTLEKNALGEATCRACYWRSWARSSRDGWGDTAEIESVSPAEAEQAAEQNGFDYLGPLTAPSLPGDPHLTRCRRCTKIAASRIGDIGFGCSCSRG